MPTGAWEALIVAAAGWTALAMGQAGGEKASALKALEGQWEVSYQIIEVTNPQFDTNQQRAFRGYIGHRYGGINCITAHNTGDILQSLYSWSPENKSRFALGDYGVFHATNDYFGGFAIPGRGEEQVAGVITQGQLSAVADIDLNFVGRTHIRSVVTGKRIGPCPG
jgi:hypothetical protein